MLLIGWICGRIRVDDLEEMQGNKLGCMIRVQFLLGEYGICGVGKVMFDMKGVDRLEKELCGGVFLRFFQGGRS